MSRYPPLQPSSITSPQQRQVYNETTATCEAFLGHKFLYKNSDDAFVGPFAALLYTPSLLKPFLEIPMELAGLEKLSTAQRETAILAVGSVYQADFELDCHSKLAILKGALTQKQTDCLRLGLKPTGEDRLDEECELAFDAALQLTVGKGALPAQLFERLVAKFDRVGALALILYVGLYCMTCVLLNGAASPGIAEENESA